MARELRDKVIVITGASSGIGAAAAAACHAAGMRVVAAARRVEKLHDVVTPMGERGLAIACDVDRDEDVAQLFAQAADRFGRVDAVFANAGYGIKERLENMTDAQVRALFETNFHGTLRCIRQGLPRLRDTTDGLKHLLICSSSASEIGIPLYGVYAATKAAQKSVAQGLRGELRGEGIAVTTVHPVGTRTEFFDTAAQVSGKATGHTGSNTPKLFEQTPQQVARTVVKALRKPKPEVWPMPLARYGLALTVMFPGLSAWALRNRKVQV